MALTYKEYLEQKKKAAESGDKDQSSLDMTLDAYNRRKRKKNKRPFSQDTLVNRLKRK